MVFAVVISHFYLSNIGVRVSRCKHIKAKYDQNCFYRGTANMNTNNDVTNIVLNILQSPELRQSITNAVTRANSPQSNFSGLSSGVVSDTGSSSRGVSETCGAGPSGIRHEMNRLFPSFRGRSTHAERKKKKIKFAESFYRRDVILLSSPTCNQTARGCNKFNAYENGEC